MGGRIIRRLRLVALAIVAGAFTMTGASAVAREDPTPKDEPFFLVATREMADPTFRESVVLIVPGQEPLVAGLILNRPSHAEVRQIFPKATLPNIAEPTYFGGPVEPSEPSMLLRSSKPPLEATRVFADIFIDSDGGSIENALKDIKAGQFRIFLGRAQWLPVQLHGEVIEGAWYVVPARPDLVFSDPKKLWSQLVEQGSLLEALERRPWGRAISRDGTPRIERQPSVDKFPICRFYKFLDLLALPTM